MSLARCPKCGDVFTKGRFAICPRCRQTEQQQFELLNRFLNMNPDATIEELERVSGIPKETLLEYVRQNKIFLDSPALKIYCEQCGTEIYNGRFCNRCAKKLASQMEATAGRLKSKK